MSAIDPTIFGDLDPRRIPIIGDDIYQVGQVIELASQPCAIDPWIAVRGIFQYAPTLIWALFQPDPLDMTFDRAGVKHNRKRYGKVRVQEINQVDLSKLTGGGWALFKTGTLTQKAGWWLIIADATSDYAINWTSLAYAFSGCTNSGQPNAFSWRPKGDGVQLVGAENTTAVTMPECLAYNGAVCIQGSQSMRTEGPRQFDFSARIVDHETGLPADGSCELLVAARRGTNFAFVGQSAPVQPEDDGPTHQGFHTLWTDHHPDTVYSLWIRPGPDTYRVSQGQLQTTGAPASGLTDMFVPA